LLVRNKHVQSTDLKLLADKAMKARGLDPADPPTSKNACAPDGKGLWDLRSLPWCSIDNGEGEEVSSKDLDQISVAERLPNGMIRVIVAVADVDALVPKDSPADRHARQNTATIYSADKIYPMIDRHLSEDLTSLNEGEDRVAVVTEMIVDADGEVDEYTVDRALVHNHVKLNYEGVGAWLQGEGDLPRALRGRDDVVQSIKLQDGVAQKFKELRRLRGSLDLQTRVTSARMENGEVTALVVYETNRAHELIENLMVACNRCASWFLKSEGFPRLQRVVRHPKYWNKIVALAKENGTDLPAEPSSKQLQDFLQEMREWDPDGFPELSLRVLKLLGRGEYEVEMPNAPALTGHFGLAIPEYSHSTAPNRRYPDLLTQRLLKAAIDGAPWPYSEQELQELAAHCTAQEANADRVQRQIQKSAAAAMLVDRVGEVFLALVSGLNENGTWVRLLEIPIEGKLNTTAELGTRLFVRLFAVQVERGFLDFEVAR
jgi:VacB/RNase II family 3'-5' exoribonuclease